MKILDKHGKAWHIINEGKTASLAQTVSADFDMFSGLAREFVVHFKTNQVELKNQSKKRKVFYGSMSSL